MLDFSPEEQSTVWPFLLLEITFILNNSWHSALCATPFEVFFGRSSRHCSIADRGDVAVWPSDEFMAFMKDSRSKCESRTEKFEKSTYPTDFWGSGNNDSETDSETDGDMGKEALQKTVNCHPIQSENIGEIQRSLLELHTERRIIELTAIEGTEKKYYENYLLHAKKSKNQDFKCGDEVWFHHPEKYGMVVVPNIQGRVTEVLPCNYYRVSYNTLEGTECTAIHCLTQPPKQNDIRVFLPILSAKGSLFKERISSLQLQITPYLKSWKQLTIQSKQNLYCNVRYMAQVVGVHADSIIQSQVHISHHKPWMQSQGQSNYCGLCAINNAYSNEKLTVDQLDNIADDLWLRQIEQFSLDLTDELQIQRDVNGFYSFEVLREVVGCFGDQLLNLNELVQEPLVPSDFSSPGEVCICCLRQDFLSLHTNCLLARTSALHFHPY